MRNILNAVVFLIWNATLSSGFIRHSAEKHVFQRVRVQAFSGLGVLDWVIANGAEVKFRLNELGVAVANGFIKKGESFIVVPSGLSVDKEKALGIFSQKLNTNTLKTGDVGFIALFLLYEKSLGESSKYANYINNLPKEVPGILSWSEREIEELITSTTRQINTQLYAVSSDFARLQANKIFFNEEDWRWAIGTVKARGCILENSNKLILVPGLELIEFDPLSTSEPFVTGAGMFGGKVIKVNAERNYDANEAIVMSYGLKSSAECLEDHGIVPDITLEDSSCELLVTIDDDIDKYPDDKRSILEYAGFGNSGKMQFDLVADNEAEIDPLLLQYLRLKHIEGKDSFILEACFNNIVWSTMALPFSKPNEMKVMQYIIDACELGLKNILDNKSDEKTRSGTSRSAAMARLRLQERAALQTSLRRAQDELEILKGPDAREYYQERRLRELNLIRPLDESEIVLGDDRAPLSDDY